MTPKQVIKEIVNDYRYSVQMGMTERQARLVMIDMLEDYVKSEQDRFFEMGEKAGRLGVLSDQLIQGAIFGGTAGKGQRGSRDRASDRDDSPS